MQQSKLRLQRYILNNFNRVIGDHALCKVSNKNAMWIKENTFLFGFHDTLINDIYLNALKIKLKLKLSLPGFIKGY